MRLSTALKLLAVLVVALAVGLVAAVKSMDLQRAKTLLAEQVSAATGRTLTLSGPLELRLGLTPRIIANGVALSNRKGGSRPEMVKVERIEAELALLPLLKREVRVLRLLVSAPDFLLETDAKGVGNWSFEPPAAAAPSAGAADKGGMPALKLSLREVRIRNASVTWRDGASGKAVVLRVHKLSVQPDPTAAGRYGVQVVGDQDARMLELSGTIGAANPGKPWSVQLKGAFDGLVAKVEGTVADPVAGRGLDLKLAAQGDELGKLAKAAGLAAADAPALGPFKLSAHVAGDLHGALAVNELELAAGRRDTLLVNARGAVKDAIGLDGAELALSVDSDNLAGLSRLVGGEVPSMGPLKLTGALSGGGHRWKLADIKAVLAGSDATGELVVDTGARPRLSGSLVAGTLSLTDFTTPASKPGEKLAPKGRKQAGDGRVFSAEPLPLAWMKAVDADLSLRATRLDVASLRFSDAGAELHLAGGKLAVKPVHAFLTGGQLEGEASLDASAKVPELAVRASARAIDLGAVLKALGVEALSGGKTDGRLEWRGQGDSVRALMASANGEALVSVGEGKLRNETLDWAGGDLLSQVAGALNPLGKSEPATPLACAVVRFVAHDGIATAQRGIAVETAKVQVVGSGTVDLRSEALDLSVSPRPRGGLGVSLGAPLAGATRLGGTLAAPSVTLDEVGVARTAVSAGAAVATGGLSLLGENLLDRLTADSAPCQTAAGKAVVGKTVKPAKAGKKARKAEGLFGR